MFFIALGPKSPNNQYTHLGHDDLTYLDLIVAYVCVYYVLFY